MTSPTESFFEELAQREHVSWLEHERGRLGFEIAQDGCLRQWTIAFNDGDLEVSQGESGADAVVRADGALFDRVVRGEENLLAAALRGEVTWTGSLDLLAQGAWLLPGPREQMGPRKVGRAERRTR